MFNNINDFNDNVFRNIVSTMKPCNPFDDLLPEKDLSLGTDIAHKLIARVQKDLPEGAAITYPFETQPYMSSRYGDGSYGIWYGSLTEETALHETVHHMFQAELGIEGVSGTIYREREVFSVHACALLIDLRGQEKHHPELIADHYDLTHAIGARIAREGHPGLLAPSARHKGGNIVVFNQEILSKPKRLRYLIYQLDVATKVVQVRDNTGKLLGDFKYAK